MNGEISVSSHLNLPLSEILGFKNLSFLCTEAISLPQKSQPQNVSGRSEI